MNGYFWLFAVLALLGMHVTAQVQVRIGKGLHYRVRMRAAGLPVAGRRGEESCGAERSLHSRRMARGILSPKGRNLRPLLKDRQFRKALGAIRLYHADVHIRLSGADAAHTALTYAALRAVLHTLLACVPASRVVSGHAGADFQAEGSEIVIRCIVGARLGKLIAATVRAGAAMIRLRRADEMEEENCAEASH